MDSLKVGIFSLMSLFDLIILANAILKNLISEENTVLSNTACGLLNTFDPNDLIEGMKYFFCKE